MQSYKYEMTFDAFVSEYVTPAAIALANKVKGGEPLTENEALVLLACWELTQ